MDRRFAIINGKVPPAWNPDSGGGTFGTGANTLPGQTGTAHFFLLPYIEGDNIYKVYVPT